MSGRPEYSVWWFFADNISHREAGGLYAKDAVDLAKRCTQRPIVSLGFVERIIITDGGDNICFEWVPGKGVTFS
jgi:hypothetical protein